MAEYKTKIPRLRMFAEPNGSGKSTPGSVIADDLPGIYINPFEVSVNACFASVRADFIRRKLLENRVSFTFETVMSATDKIELIHAAQQLGYRTYLYYIATDDPEINIIRVRQRVAAGGHNVPRDKIVSRYQRSLNQLPQAVKATNNHSDRLTHYRTRGDNRVRNCRHYCC